MKNLILTIIALFTVSALQAEDFSFAYEGDAKLRKRLESLQGSKTPPKINLAEWANSKDLSLEDLKGKIVVLDFSATWCGPCISSISHNNEIHNKYPDDVVFIGVCHPRGAEKMMKVLKDKGIEYPIAIDTDGKVADAYHVNGYPDYFIIDRDGTLVVADCANSKVSAVLAKMIKK